MKKLENISHILGIKKRIAENDLLKQQALIQALEREIECAGHELEKIGTLNSDSIAGEFNLAAAVNQNKWADGLRNKTIALHCDLTSAKHEFLDLQKVLFNVSGKSDLVAKQLKRQQILHRQMRDAAEEDRRNETHRSWQGQE